MSHTTTNRSILSNIVCYSQQIHTGVTKISDNKVTHSKNENMSIKTIVIICLGVKPDDNIRIGFIRDSPILNC